MARRAETSERDKLRMISDNLTKDEKKEREKIYFAVESCVQGFCTSSHAIGYNDCMLEMAKHGAAHEPIIYPEQ